MHNQLKLWASGWTFNRKNAWGLASSPWVGFAAPPAIPWLEGERTLISAALERVRAEHPARIVFFIGPEGDFTSQEVARAVNKGAWPLDLGKNVLKVDTAAMAVVAYAKFILSERQSC